METSTTPAPTLPCRAERPRIYVACLAAYNGGRLHGRWINVTEPDEVGKEVRAMLAASPEPDADEHAIHDYEGFEGCAISEWASFDIVCALADFIEQHGRLGARLETGPEIPDALQYYIDWESMGRDMELNGDVFTITLGFDEVHVFWNR